MPMVRDNILSVLKHLVMSDELADSSEYRHGNMVFFDLLGLMMVAYPAHVGTVINYMVAVAVVIYLGGKCLLTSSVGASLQYSILYLTGLAVPYVYIMSLIRVVFEVFTPIQGRSKDKIPPDIILASLVTLATVILSSYFIHFIYLSHSTKRVLAVLGSVFTLMFVLVSCGLFFPFSAELSSPRPKRVFVQVQASLICLYSRVFTLLKLRP
ncbi:endoplasmic reticulum metallopeptidase 1-like isoform X1 [Sinocyclocheilus grahami]|uniref:endoplasmic reticulum metallopeptidase 1-like isoform X1 n=1 Tax=Sinocyclocheilus grahami TaxID=75366 RepID=UPI0007AD2888|nr:PREDICTED: endoplasmic reticulum metallopeptidase 1-like isoform X1 [Sinocyclocheilus grahami]